MAEGGEWLRSPPQRGLGPALLRGLPNREGTVYGHFDTLACDLSLYLLMDYVLLVGETRQATHPLTATETTSSSNSDCPSQRDPT